MFDDFVLAVGVARGRRERRTYRVPMSAALHADISAAWYDDYVDATGREHIEFDLGYEPDETQMFAVEPFALPGWLRPESFEPLRELDIVPNEQNIFEHIQCVFAFARDADLDRRVLLFQNFSRSKLIKPSWRSMVFYSGVYQASERHGLQLGGALSAVFVGPSQEGRLLFSRLRHVSTYLPMEEYYREATTNEIREILQHDALLVHDPEGIADVSSQWYARRFAMLRDSRILDRYAPPDLQRLAAAVNVQLEIEENRIRLPVEKPRLRTVLTFLNEERFRGPITENLFEANSKRRVGA